MKVLFHHIPKTAGSSLIQQIKQHITPTCDGARYDHELDKFKISSEEFKFYHGHYSFDKVNEFKTLNPGAMIFTFIRNPLNRVISHYYNRIDEKKVMKELELVERRTNDPKIKEKRKLYQDEIFGMSLSDFLSSDLRPLKESYQNRHVRYFCARQSYRENQLLASKDALDNLLNFYSFTGVTEYMDASVKMLEQSLNLPLNTLDSGMRINTNTLQSNKKYDVDLENILALVKNNILDIDLYHYVLTQQKELLKVDSKDIGSSPIETVLINGPEVISVESNPEEIIRDVYIAEKLKLVKRAQNKYLKKTLNLDNKSEDISFKHREYIRDNRQTDLTLKYILIQKRELLKSNSQ